MGQNSVTLDAFPFLVQRGDTAYPECWDELNLVRGVVKEAGPSSIYPRPGTRQITFQPITRPFTDATAYTDVVSLNLRVGGQASIIISSNDGEVSGTTDIWPFSPKGRFTPARFNCESETPQSATYGLAAGNVSD